MIGAIARNRIYYGWIVVGVTFLTLLVSAGVRSAPTVLVHPLEDDLGWGRASISFAISVGLLLYGLSGPFSGMLMGRFGPRRLMLAGLALIGVSTTAGATMTTQWQLVLFWGVLSGVGTGLAATVLGATVATRWFVERRGLVLGFFGAASSAGQLIFVPALMGLVTTIGWRAGTVVLAVCATVVLVPVFILMRDEPAAMGLQPYGGAPPAAGPTSADPASPGGAMGRALRTPEFWLLAGSFFICGATSNGLIGAHFVPHALDHGIAEATAAGALAVMGAMNFVGTIASGWLTDRADPRRLLACYYTLRGLSLFILPFVTDFGGLAIFAVVFGLDYIATVPPTAALCADIFGRRHVGIVYGWVFFSHQVGAALAAYLGGLSRDLMGDYQAAFLAGGVLAVLGGLMALRIDRAAAPRLQPRGRPGLTAAPKPAGTRAPGDGEAASGHLVAQFCAICDDCAQVIGQVGKANRAMEKMVGAFEARRQFGKILNEVSSHGDRFVVERHGEPVAAVVPIKVYRQWKQQRAAFFDQMRATAERANLSPEEAAELVNEAIRAVRGQS